MRYAVTLGRGNDGKFYVLSDKGEWVCVGKKPLDIQDQLATVKNLTITGGRVAAEDVKPLLNMAFVLSTSRAMKKRRFDPNALAKAAEAAKQRAALLAKRKKEAPQDFEVPKPTMPRDVLDTMTSAQLLQFAKDNRLALPPGKPFVDRLRSEIRKLWRPTEDDAEKKAKAEAKAAKKAAKAAKKDTPAG